jgi:hypothetical protein
VSIDERLNRLEVRLMAKVEMLQAAQVKTQEGLRRLQTAQQKAAKVERRTKAGRKPKKAPVVTAALEAEFKDTMKRIARLHAQGQA